MNKRKFKSPIRFVISEFHDANPEEEMYGWEEVEAELYEEKGEEHVYIEREKLQELLDSNSVVVKNTLALKFESGKQIDLTEVDEVSLSIS